MEAQKHIEARKREENLTKTFWKLAHAKRAVSLVQTTCDLYLKHAENEYSPLHIPLLCSICVMYARPFTDNDGVGMISSKFTRFPDGKLQNTHDLLWDARKRFYAHSDATVTAVSLSGENLAIQPIDVIISRRDTGQGSDLLTFGYNLHEIRLRGIVIPDVQKLCTELDRRLGAAITETMRQLFEPKTLELMQLFERQHSDQIVLRCDSPFATTHRPKPRLKKNAARRKSAR
jgi:hypothetical protein